MYYLRFLFLPPIAFNIEPPILRSKPCLVVGIPVALATFPLAALMPTARFNENENPNFISYNLKLLIDSFIYWAIIQPFFIYPKQ